MLCEELLSGRGEASGVALAREILTRYSDADHRSAHRLLRSAGSAIRARPCAHAERDRGLAERAERRDRRRSPSGGRAAPAGIVPQAQSCARRHRRALVRMREQLIDAMDPSRRSCGGRCRFRASVLVLVQPRLSGVARIDWSTPANILEKIIQHEAVHKIRSWDDLRRRIDPPDRCCFAFFHPALDRRAFDLRRSGAHATRFRTRSRRSWPPSARCWTRSDATTAVFYSISNCQRGLAGVTFGNFLIKQVVEEISRDNPRLSNFRHIVAGAGLRRLAEARTRTRAPRAR